MKTKSSTDIVEILKSALERLKTANRPMSVRALAARLELSPSYLHKVFRGEKPLSLKLLPTIAQKLQLDHHEVAELQRLVLRAAEERKFEKVRGLRKAEKNDKSTPLVQEYEALGRSDLWLLENWYILPIYNLAATEGFTPSADWVAGRLGISTEQAQKALQRLIEAGYLVEKEDGSMKPSKMRLRFPTQRSHPTVRNFHSAMIRKSEKQLMQAKDESAFRRRLISGITLAADPNKMEEAKRVLEEAAYRAAEILTDGECTEVIQLNLQMFPLT